MQINPANKIKELYMRHCLFWSLLLIQSIAIIASESAIKEYFIRDNKNSDYRHKYVGVDAAHIATRDALMLHSKNKHNKIIKGKCEQTYC